MNTKNDLKLHIIGGFLGSGKTTAIISAARYLARKGKRVGVITNDQGKHLVDTTILRGQGLPAMEVTGGCFCCHFDDLNERLKDLVNEYDPDVIFAESVGSCADVVATVVRPLLEMEIGTVRPASYTVFTDIRILRRFLLDLEMPFSDGVNYIFGKQIEEAGLLLINKIDLVDEDTIGEVVSLVNEEFPHIFAIPISALDADAVAEWMEALQNGAYPPPVHSLNIDYDRYAEAEAELVWIDREYHIKTNASDIHGLLISVINGLRKLTIQNGWFDGHIKLAISAGDYKSKISIAQSGEIISDSAISETLKAEPLPTGEVTFLLNILIAGEKDLIVEKIEQYLRDICTEQNVLLIVKGAFEKIPAYPKPTYRIPDRT